jgi:hypothetical protein
MSRPRASGPFNIDLLHARRLPADDFRLATRALIQINRTARTA